MGMSVSQELYTQVATISPTLMVLVCLLYSSGIAEPLLAHFSVVCPVRCDKARIYRCSLPLHVKFRVCKAKRMWNWRKNTGFLKEIFHCVAETREPKGLLSVKAQNLRNKF